MGKHHAGGTLRRAITPRSVALLIVGVVTVAACSTSPDVELPKLTANADGSFTVAAQPRPGQIPIGWTLDHVDRASNRIYFSTSKVDCSYPETVVVQESASTIDIQVYGNPPPDGPCTANGYVVSGFISPRVSIGSRTITH